MVHIWFMSLWAQHIGLGSAWWVFCFSHLGSLMWLMSSESSTMAGLSKLAFPCLMFDAGYWLTLSLSRLEVLILWQDFKSRKRKENSLFVTFAYISLDKTSDMAKPRVTMGGDYARAQIQGGRLSWRKPLL